MPTLSLLLPADTQIGRQTMIAVRGSAMHMRVACPKMSWADGGRDANGEYILCALSDLESLIAGTGMRLGPRMTEGPPVVGYGVAVEKLSDALDALMQDVEGLGPLRQAPLHARRTGARVSQAARCDHSHQPARG